MQDCVSTVTDFGNVREAVCVSTRKIMDACRDQDCSEDVAVYLTAGSQETLESATNVKARCAELLYADVSVEPLNYRDGYYCVNIQYYYRVIADAVLCAVRPAAIYGLATVTKRVTLFGGEEAARRFRSDGTGTCGTDPVAVVEAIDPSVLGARIVDLCHCSRGETRACGCQDVGLPESVACAFDDDLIMGGQSRQLVVTLGQFSLVRLERETQLLIPSYDYCMPEQACSDGECGCQVNPCEAFFAEEFPVEAFFPQGQPAQNGTSRSRSCGCGKKNGNCSSCDTARAAVAAAQTALDDDCQQEEDRSTAVTETVLPVTVGRNRIR